MVRIGNERQRDVLTAGIDRSGTNRHGAGNRFVLECTDQVVNDGHTVVIEDFGSAEPLDVVEIHWRSNGDDFLAGSDSELNGITANACCASSDKQSLASWLWRRYGRLLKRQLVFLEQPAGCSRQTQRENSRAFIGHGARNWRCHMVQKNCVVLKSAACRVVKFLPYPICMTDNTIASSETSDSTANVHDLPCTVCAEDEWKFDPGEQKAALILFHPINGVDSYSAVFDDDLILTGGRL